MKRTLTGLGSVFCTIGASACALAVVEDSLLVRPILASFCFGLALLVAALVARSSRIATGATAACIAGGLLAAAGSADANLMLLAIVGVLLFVASELASEAVEQANLVRVEDVLLVVALAVATLTAASLVTGAIGSAQMVRSFELQIAIIALAAAAIATAVQRLATTSKAGNGRSG